LTLGLLGTFTIGCGHPGTTSRAESSSVARRADETLVPVQLPDVSRSPASIRRQLETTYDRLQPITAAPGSSAELRGEAMGQMGRLLMAADYPDAAERCFKHAARLQPGDARWPYLLGHLYRRRREPTLAAAAFAATLRLQRDDVAALVWLGDTYLALGQADRAEPLFERALARQPNLGVALYGIGRVALARHEFPRAVQSLTAALNLDPRASVIHRPLAAAYRATGDARRADAHMRQAGTGTIGPPDPQMQELSGLLDSAPAFEYRGIRALERGQADVAEGLFRRGLDLEPNAASLRHHLGVTLLQLGDEPGAMAEFARALDLAPGYAPTHYSLGVLLATHGRHADAAARFATALTHAPDSLDARLALADMLTATGHPAEALRHFDTVLDVRPHDANATLGRAVALLHIGRQRDATDDLHGGGPRRPARRTFQPALVRAVARAGQ
jgi:tetratricopeptide (TPR) repeat protein